MSTELKKYQGAFKAALDVLNSARRQINEKSGCGYLADTIILDIVALENMVAPQPPEMEEVEIERFVVFYPDGSTSHILTREGLQGFDCKRGTVKRVSHMVERPKPQPVKRTVSGTVQWRAQGGMTFPVGKDVNFDWDDVLGKTGELTFTWTEDPK